MISNWIQFHSLLQPNNGMEFQIPWNPTNQTPKRFNWVIFVSCFCFCRFVEQGWFLGQSLQITSHQNGVRFQSLNLNKNPNLKIYRNWIMNSKDSFGLWLSFFKDSVTSFSISDSFHSDSCSMSIFIRENETWLKSILLNMTIYVILLIGN